MKQSDLYATTIQSIESSLPVLLNATSLVDLIPRGQKILLQPNLTEALNPPVTTPVRLVAFMVDYLRRNRPESHIRMARSVLGSAQTTVTHIV